MRSKTASIRLRVTAGEWESVGSDTSGKIWHENLDLNWDTWGPSTATFDLRRDPTEPWPDLVAFTDVEIEVAGVQVWKGRISGTPTRDGADRSMSVQCEGMQYHLDDDLYRPAYVHTRLSEYKDGRSYPSADLTKLRQSATVSSDGVITIGWPNGTALATNDAVAIVLDMGPATPGKRIAINYDFIGGISNSSFYIRGHDDPNPLLSFLNATTFGLGGGSGSGAASGTLSGAKRYVSFVIIYTGGATTLTADLTFRVSSALVAADTNYESGGVSILKASTVVLDALAKATTLLDPDRSRISTTSFSIPDLYSRDYKTPREVWTAVNAFHGYNSKIDEMGRPIFEPLSTDLAIEVGKFSGLSGQDASLNSGRDIYNRVIVTGTTPAGDPIEVARSHGVGSAEAIGSPSPDNPSFATNTTSWSVLSGSIARDTGTFDSSPASGLWSPNLSLGFDRLTETFTGTFAEGRNYLLTLRMRAAANVTVTGQFGQGTDLHTLPINLTTSWQTVTFSWTPAADSASAVLEFFTFATTGVHVDTLQLYLSQSTLVDKRAFRRTAILPIQAPLASDGVAAAQIGDVYLTNHRLAQFKGQYEVTGPGKHPLTGMPIPPEQFGMYTNGLMTFSDRIDPDTGAIGRDGRIASVSYNFTSDTASVSIDNTSRNFESMLSRLALLSGSG